MEIHKRESNVSSTYGKEDLKQGIREACASVTPAMLFKVKKSFINRINMYLDVNGQQFEQLLKYKKKI